MPDSATFSMNEVSTCVWILKNIRKKCCFYSCPYKLYSPYRMTNTNLLLILLLYCLMLSTFSSCTIQCTAESWQCVGKRQRRDVFTPNLSHFSTSHKSLIQLTGKELMSFLQYISNLPEESMLLFCYIFLYTCITFYNKRFLICAIL